MGILLNIAVALLATNSLSASCLADVSKYEGVSFSKTSPVDSSLWIAAPGRGLVRVGRSGKAFSYSSAKGDFPCDSIVALDFDAAGVLWMLDARGDYYSYSSYRGFVRETAPAELIESLGAAVSQSLSPAENGGSLSEDEADSPQNTRSSRAFRWWHLLLMLLAAGVFFYIGRRSARVRRSSAASSEDGVRSSEREQAEGPEAQLTAEQATLQATEPAPVQARVAAQRRETEIAKPALAPTAKPALEPEAEQPQVLSSKSAPIQESEQAPAPAAKPTPAQEPNQPTPVDVSKSNVIKAESQAFYNEVVELINNNFSDPDFSVESIAGHFGISRVHLNRKLKAAGHESPSELIKAARMNLASELLRSGEFTVVEVARKAGFSSAAYFSSAFKDYFNQSPSSFLPTSTISNSEGNEL